MRKGPLWPESVSYQKRDGRAGPRPSFSWYDTDFLDFFEKKNLIFFLGGGKSVSYQKKGPRPSFFWYDTDSGHKGPFCMAPPILLHYSYKITTYHK